MKQDAHSQYSAAEPERIEYELPVPAQAPEPGQRKPFSIQLRVEDWLEHGYTPVCSKCIAARDHGWSYAGSSRSKACVDRCKAAPAVLDAVPAVAEASPARASAGAPRVPVPGVPSAPRRMEPDD